MTASAGVRKSLPETAVTLTPMEAICAISPKRCLRFLIGAAVILTITGIASDQAPHFFDNDLVWPIARQFDFVEEGNFVNWYQSATLLWCAVTLAAVALAQKSCGGKFRLHWAGLAAAFLFLSIDESAQVHDTTISNLIAQIDAHRAAENAAPSAVSGEASDLSPLQKARWMLVYLPILGALGIPYLHFLLRLPRRTSALLIFAGCQYVGGAVVIELVSDWYAGKYGDADLLYFLLGNSSELFEMLGVAWCSYAALDYLATERASLRLTVASSENPI